MRISKIFYSLVVAGLLAISNVSHAAVYDFGSLLTASEGYAAPNSFQSAPFARLATTDSGGGVWNFMLSIKNNFFSSFGDNASIGAINFAPGSEESAGDSFTVVSITVDGIDGGHSATYAPNTSPVPEPETYAMILAGLGLIAFTARRRKENT